MKKSFYTVLPFLLAGFMLPNDNCTKPKVQDVQFDGPYVFYSNNNILVKYVYEENGIKTVRMDSVPLADREKTILRVATDDPDKAFTVKLKSSLVNENPEYNDVKKMFIISDIEGNFSAFRKLLLSNNVIDSNFNWTYGDGHLVLTGDFVDRGAQVTEVLWLIYSLEEKAKVAGGYVHYVLGNHEIMVMSGDVRYIHPKYAENATLLNTKYVSLFSENTELGRWLRTKNVVEKIGDIVFAHGGISSEVNHINISASEINVLARPFYPDSLYKYPDIKTEILYSDRGPFWYRGYYTGTPKAAESQIDSTLQLYKVKHIATGHTIIADTISSLYNGKVFNTDVHHSKSNSEALLYEAGKFYRVNSLGEKFEW